MSSAEANAAEPAALSESAIKSRRSVARRLALIAALGGLLYGYDSAVINGATNAIKTEFATGDALLGLAVGSALISGGIGALLAGRIADRIGRVPMMKIAAVLFLICAIGCAIVPNIIVLVIFRVLGGFAAGVAAMVAPVYIAEIAPTDERGVLGAFQQLGIVIGSSSHCSSTRCSCTSPAAPACPWGRSKPGSGCSCAWPCRPCCTSCWP